MPLPTRKYIALAAALLLCTQAQAEPPPTNSPQGVMLHGTGPIEHVNIPLASGVPPGDPASPCRFEVVKGELKIQCPASQTPPVAGAVFYAPFEGQLVKFTIRHSRDHTNIYPARTGLGAKTEYRVEWELNGPPQMLCPIEVRGASPPRYINGYALVTPHAWTASGELIEAPGYFTFSCIPTLRTTNLGVTELTALNSGGVIAKCVDLGFPPWTEDEQTEDGRENELQTLRLHQACVRMASADYCNEGKANTIDGTPIAFWAPGGNLFTLNESTGRIEPNVPAVNSGGKWVLRPKLDDDKKEENRRTAKDYILESVWTVDRCGKTRPLCVGKARWSGIPLEGTCLDAALRGAVARQGEVLVPASLSQPGPLSCDADVKVAYCDDLSLEDLNANYPLLVTYSAFIDKPLVRFDPDDLQIPTFMSTASVNVKDLESIKHSYEFDDQLKREMGLPSGPDNRLRRNQGSLEGPIISPSIINSSDSEEVQKSLELMGLKALYRYPRTTPSHPPLFILSDKATIENLIRRREITGYNENVRELEGYIFKNNAFIKERPLILWRKGETQVYATSTKQPATGWSPRATLGFLPTVSAAKAWVLAQNSNPPSCETGNACQVDTLVTTVSAGGNYSLVLSSDGTVWAWGDNGFGQLGDGTTTSKSMLVQVPGLTSVTALAANSYHSLALRSDGTVWTWGRYITPRTAPVQVPGLTDVTALAPGGGHSLVLRRDGTVWAWGSNESGQLGDGTTTSQSTPVRVSGLTSVTALAAGPSHSLALRSDGTVWAWGQNVYGQLGIGQAPSQSTPVRVFGLDNIITLSAGFGRSLALRRDGTVWAWGYNAVGQLGDGTTTTRLKPVQVSGLTNVTTLATGGGHSLALRRDGTVWAWGQNILGELGDGTATLRSTPVQVSKLTDIAALSAGAYHSLALRRDGTVWAWGNNKQGQLGKGFTSARTIPMQVIGTTNLTTLASGHFHSLALHRDGTVWAWGFNDYGQLGDGTTIPRSAPMQVSKLTDIAALAAGAYHSLALRRDGTVWAWGRNYFGQPGDRTATVRATPVQLSGLSNVTALAAGGSYSLALRRDGTVWGWGQNEGGQLGDRSTITRATPVRVSGLSNVTALAADAGHALALRGDGTVWAWGQNEKGQLGDGTTANRVTPVQVPALTNVIALAAGTGHALALSKDGTVWAWGFNGDGELGDGTTTARATPVKVSGLTNITVLAAGWNNSLALRRDGNVWAWGSNDYGQLGDGTLGAIPAPVLLP